MDRDIYDQRRVSSGLQDNFSMLGALGEVFSVMNIIATRLCCLQERNKRYYLIIVLDTFKQRVREVQPQVDSISSHSLKSTIVLFHRCIKFVK